MFHECSQCFSAPEDPTLGQVYWSRQNALETCLTSNPWLAGPEEILITQRAAAPAAPGILGPSTGINSSNS